MIYHRDYVKRKAISCNDAALWQTYRTLRNMVTSTIRRNKKWYHDSRITDCKSNPKQLWNVIGQLTGAIALLMSVLNMLLRTLVHSSNNYVLGFDCKLLSMCSDLIAPIITKFGNVFIHTK